MIEMKTPEILLPALRQYQHNDCSGLLAGFDHDETVKVFKQLQIALEDLITMVEQKNAGDFSGDIPLEDARKVLEVSDEQTDK